MRVPYTAAQQQQTGYYHQFVDQFFDIAAEEACIDREELIDDAAFSDLGIDDILAGLILGRFRETTNLDLTEINFRPWSDVRSFKKHIASISPPPSPRPNEIPVLDQAMRPSKRHKSLPLAVRLQGKASAPRKIFLLPDGSGSAMAYAQLPALGSDVCLYGLNSPHLHAVGNFGGTLEDLAEPWVDAIQEVQPHGPYILGGWSAGGYYSFEVAKRLMRQKEVVEKLILIDSPCRLEFEALPMEVINYLASNNLIGNWDSGKTPDWLVSHFDSTIKAVEKYMPTPMSASEGNLPEVFILWASDGVFPKGGSAGSGLDLNKKITRFMVEPRQEFSAHGWDRLFPHHDVAIATMPGHHFTIVHPPFAGGLASLIQDVIADSPLKRKNKWEILAAS